MLDNTLIEKALALTGKTMEDMYPWMTSGYENEYGELDFGDKFSIECFCYYLQSPEFIKKYNAIYTDDINCSTAYVAMTIGFCISEYQLKNEGPLEDLLSKI